uniref:Uncharacterized protein n=1 Tax=Vespula pensylvanica TaxID=30213 RepID=A0A834PFQ8_VESPE|nr:hypothetical protein H0235_001228 [Vespula pensylvanica]
MTSNGRATAKMHPSASHYIIEGARAPTSKPNQAKSNQAEPSQAEPSQAEPSQAKLSQAKPSQAKPSQVKQSGRCRAISAGSSLNIDDDGDDPAS